MRIGIDIDEVLVDFLTPFLEYHNARYGTAYQWDDFHSFGMHHVMDETPQKIAERIEAFLRTDKFKNLQPVPGAVEAVNTLAKNHELIIVSSRNDSVHEDTRRWLDEHFPAKIAEVHFSDHPYASRDSVHTKVGLCKLVRLDLLIEDALEYALPSAEAGIRVLLFDTPWNRRPDLPANVTRVYSWEGIVDVIKKNRI